MERFGTAEGILANIAATEILRLLVPKYDFFQKDPNLAIQTGTGDCKAVGILACALKPELRFVRSVTKTASSSRISAAYIHYLAVDRANKTIIHSTGSPLDPAGAHIRGLHTRNYAFGWSKKGESQAQPKSGLGMLDRICEGSDHEERRSGSYSLTMDVEDPTLHLKGCAMEELAALISTSLENMSFEV